jgi:methylmalonyl-CoA mutase
MDNYLFNEFQEVTPQAWKTKIQVDLKGADYNDTLLWKTNEGITVKPFYSKDDRHHQNISLPKKEFNICQSIIVKEEKEANSIAIDGLKRGANSVEFIVYEHFNFKILLTNINFKKTVVYFKFKFLASKLISDISKFADSENCYFNVDIIGNIATTGNWYKNKNDDFKEIESIVKNTRNSICVNT